VLPAMETYLVQRLKKPPASSFQARASEVFGGGMMQMSGDAWRVLQQVCDLDYMGAAEYEFGAFPQAMQDMLRRKYSLWSFAVTDVKPGIWRVNAMDSFRYAEIRNAKERGEKPPRMTKKHKAHLMHLAGLPPQEIPTVWVWSCDEIHNRDAVKDLIRRVADGKVRVKGGAHLYFDPNPRWETRVFGWVDLNNRLCWFTDETMSKGWESLFSKEEQPQDDQGSEAAA